MSLRKQVALMQRIDWLFVMAIIGLAVIGMLFIYSASHRGDDAFMTALTRRQVMWFFAGTLCFLAVVLIDYRLLVKQAWWIYAVCSVLLVLVLVMGVKIYGSYRWLNLFGIQVQPSEFAKIGTILMLAWYLGQPARDMAEFKTFFIAFAIMTVPFMLVLQQPDLDTALMLIPITLVMLFVGGVPLRYILILGGVVILLSPLGWFMLDDYQQERILVFFDASRDPLGSGWSKIQSEIAVGSGGWSGKGLRMGTQNILGFLPRTVAPTDFIFSVIAEESGFIGCILVIGLYAVLFLRGFHAAVRARDKTGRMLIAGFMTLLFFHMFVNIAMASGLAPVAGLPLPLISYGGSFMVCTMAGLGLVQSVYVRRIER